MKTELSIKVLQGIVRKELKDPTARIEIYHIYTEESKGEPVYKINLITGKNNHAKPYGR